MLAKKPTGTHKRLQIERILSFFPEVPVVLIGDSGEHDPEIFLKVVEEFPGRVDSVYIRCVGDAAQRLKDLEQIGRQVRSLGTDFLAVPDTEAAAVHAAGRGLIPAQAIEAVSRTVANRRHERKNPAIAR